MSDKDLSELVEKVAAQLGEHFDGVQILATKQGEGGGTACIMRGVGNWYARQGMAHEFIEQDKAQEHAQAIKRAQESE